MAREIKKEIKKNDLMDKIVSLCKRRGFIFPNSEIYGGLANAWDYGPLGVALKNNIKKEWWRIFVESRSDMVGFDASIIMNPKVWEATGHVENFSDPLVECKHCHTRFRADDLVGMVLDKSAMDFKKWDMKKKEAFMKKFPPCPACKSKDEWTWPKMFNLMFKTNLGSTEDASNEAYLRPETAQGMFVNFKNVLQTMRPELPFGMAQIGKAFRNEITPGNFIFRTREFEQMEIEYFVEAQEWKKQFEVWRKEMQNWIKHLGVDYKKIEEFEVPSEERAHYSEKTIDFKYHFPFGISELYGLAYRGDFDLRRHAEKSGEDLHYTDPKTGKKFIPHVIEPSLGVERSILVSMLEAYHEEDAPTAERGESETRVVMRFPKWLSPIKVAVLPLSKHEKLAPRAKEIYEILLPRFACEYDETQSIGKRYRRQDEIGTPYCITVDFETLNDNAVTVRDRDSMKQERVSIKELVKYLLEKLG